MRPELVAVTGSAISGNPFVTTNPDVTREQGMTKVSDIPLVSDVTGTTGIKDTDQPGIDIEGMEEGSIGSTRQSTRSKGKQGSLAWKSMCLKLKEFRGRIDEEGGRIRKTRHRRERYQARWEGTWLISGAPTTTNLVREIPASANSGISSAEACSSEESHTP